MLARSALSNQEQGECKPWRRPSTCSRRPVRFSHLLIPATAMHKRKLRGKAHQRATLAQGHQKTHVALRHSTLHTTRTPPTTRAQAAWIVEHQASKRHKRQNLLGCIARNVSASCARRASRRAPASCNVLSSLNQPSPCLHRQTEHRALEVRGRGRGRQESGKKGKLTAGVGCLPTWR